MFNHVNGGTFCNYTEEVFMDIRWKLGLVRELPQKSRTIPPTVSLLMPALKITFIRQVKYPNTLEIGIQIVRVGNSSFTYRTGIFVKGEIVPAAIQTSTIIFFDVKAKKPFPVP